MIDRNDLSGIIRTARVTLRLTLRELSAMSGVSSSHLGRIERGERKPSATILRKLAKPLGFGETEMLTFAGYLSTEASSETQSPSIGRLDPYVAAILSQEPVETQRVVVSILALLKSMAKGVRQEKGSEERG